MSQAAVRARFLRQRHYDLPRTTLGQEKGIGSVPEHVVNQPSDGRADPSRADTVIPVTGEVVESAPTTGPNSTTWRWIRRGAFALWLAALISISATSGLPTARIPIAIFIITGLAISRIGYGWRQLGQVVLDWLPFTAVLLLYDRTRGVADNLGIPLHEADILHAEKWLFAGTEPTVWMQNHFYTPGHVHWYDALATLIYTSHFLATPILAAILWLRNREQWLRHISRVILLSVAGLITYILFPEAPPWLAAKDGLSPPVSRLSPRGWRWFHLGHLSTVLSKAQSEGTNAVAAMPSLHTAFATLVAIVIGSQLRSRWCWLLVLYPIAMGVTLVYTGEHYVLDLAAGVVYAVVVHLLLNRWEAHRRSRHACNAPSPAAELPGSALDQCENGPVIAPRS